MKSAFAFPGAFLGFLLALPSFASQTESFPLRPDTSLTPGSLCERPDSKRYPEGIPYCSRNVASSLKREVMRTYDDRLGYRVTQMDRSAFKIDHHIPLCMGGSNEADNLWPQHESVFKITDPLEQTACDKMAKGRLRQAQAVELIRRAKQDLDQAPAVLEYIRGL